MKRLLFLLLLLPLPAAAQVITSSPATRLRYTTDCDTTACTAVNQVCTESAGGAGAFYICDTTTGFFKSATDAPNLFHVCKRGCPYSSIGVAANAAALITSGGTAATIAVGPGVYVEDATVVPQTGAVNTIEQGDLELRGPITLIGSGRTSTIIECMGNAPNPGYMVMASGQDVVIQDLTIRTRSDAGIGEPLDGDGQNSNRVYVHNVTIQNDVGARVSVIVNSTGNSTLTDSFNFSDFRLETLCSGILNGSGATLYVDGATIFRKPTTVQSCITMYGLSLGTSLGIEGRAFIKNLYVETHRAGSGVLGTNACVIVGGTDVFKGTTSALTCRANDEGTSTTGDVAGLNINLNTNAGSILDCYGCDIQAARPGSAGRVAAVLQEASAANKIRLYGGVARASGAEAGPMDLERTSTGEIHVAGIDYLTSNGAITPIQDVARSDAALTLRGQVRIPTATDGFFWYDSAEREASVTGSDIAGSQAGNCTFAAAATCSVTLPVTEANANYLILLGCNGNKTFWWSGKLTTGFTVNASASSSDTCDWRLTR